MAPRCGDRDQGPFARFSLSVDATARSGRGVDEWALGGGVRPGPSFSPARAPVTAVDGPPGRPRASARAVGAATSVSNPWRIRGHASAGGGVGPSGKRWVTTVATAGGKSDSTAGSD